jgi:thioredoxin 1
MNTVIPIGWLVTVLLAWNISVPIGSHGRRRGASVRRPAIRSILAQRVAPRLERLSDKVDGAPPIVAEPVTVTDADFERVVLRSPIPVLVHFGAVWCPPCQAIAPTIDELAREYQGRIIVAKLDIDENPQSFEKYDIRGISTLLLFQDGQVVERVLGRKPKEDLNRVLDSLWEA